MLGNIKMAQMVSLLFVTIGIIIFIIKGKGSKMNNRYNDLENVENVQF